MGANEKHDATYHGREYTPDTEDLRDLWVDSKLDHLPGGVALTQVPIAQAEFNRWLETVRAEAKAEAWDEGFSAGWDEAKDPGAFVNDAWDTKTPNPYKEQS